MSGSFTSCERVKAALEHREADHIPFDLGGSVLTGINKIAYQRLRAHLGLPYQLVHICDPIQQLARVHDDVLDRLHVDVRCVDPDPPARAPLATDVVREGAYDVFTDEWGIAWRMPADGGLYFDMWRHPLADAQSVDDLEKYPWPDPVDSMRFTTMKQRADHFVNDEGRAYILGRHSAGIFEVALWMRGFEKFFMDLALDPGFAGALLDIITELKMQYWARAIQTVGDNVLVISEADDVGLQRGPMISKQMYKALIAPRHRRLFSFLRQKASTRVYLFYHSCGSVRELLPSLIEEGVDILNPVQVSAYGMETAALKKDFGKEITFWGGGVDTQHVLPHGTPQQVRDDVKRRIDDLAPGGGFVFNTVHNVQADVPPENYMAMWETLQRHGHYD